MERVPSRAGGQKTKVTGLDDDAFERPRVPLVRPHPHAADSDGKAHRFFHPGCRRALDAAGRRYIELAFWAWRADVVPMSTFGSDE